MANKRNTEIANITRESLAMALEELMMAEKDCSITAICKRAGVSRNAFYRHFKDTDEVAIYYLILGWAKYCENVGFDGTPQDAVTGHLIRYFYSQKAFAGLLKQQEKTHLIEQLFRKALISPEVNGTARYGSYLLTYVIYSVIRAMIDNDFAETPEQIDALLKMLEQKNNDQNS